MSESVLLSVNFVDGELKTQDVVEELYPFYRFVTYYCSPDNLSLMVLLLRFMYRVL